jgi:hypothetical protein
MFKTVREYIVMVSKIWAKAIAGPALALVSIILLLGQQVIFNVPNSRFSIIAGWITLGVAILLIFQAQYEAWKMQREARIKAEIEKRTKEGRHVGLDFYDLLIEPILVNNARLAVRGGTPRISGSAVSS